LPVWQDFYDKYSQKVSIISIAIDLQGYEKVNDYVSGLNLTFPTLIDQKNITGDLYGFKAIPNGILIDENGDIVAKQLGNFDIRKVEIRNKLEKWIINDQNFKDQISETKFTSRTKKSNQLLEKGMPYFQSGDIKTALEIWKQGIKIDPKNYIVRKQVWAIEYPEKFYSGEINYQWQKEQIDLESLD
tara:strand:- start:16388 stop:16948 length:561 start_codon:yes stop_codon:yes gene_type:complete